MNVYSFTNAFVKVTAWPIQKILFRTRIRYADRERQGRSVRGPAILVSNHTAVFDYAVMLFVFPGRTLRCQMAEVVFDKKPLGWLLRFLGGIRIDRSIHDVAGVGTSERVLREGGVVCVFPEGRIPRPEEERPLAFRGGAAWLALTTGAPVIPVYTDGHYFGRAPAHVVIGTPMRFDGAAQPENVRRVSEALREEVIRLGEMTHE